MHLMPFSWSVTSDSIKNKSSLKLGRLLDFEYNITVIFSSCNIHKIFSWFIDFFVLLNGQFIDLSRGLLGSD